MEMMIDKENILDQLVDIYLHHEEWQGGNKVSAERARKCYEIAYDKGCIVLCLDSLEQVMGYGEFKKINYEQMGRIICEAPFDIEHEDITSGNIGWISGVYIKPEFRDGIVLDVLRTEFFKRTFRCEYFIGEARRKKSQPLKVFSRQAFYDKYAKQEIAQHG